MAGASVIGSDPELVKALQLNDEQKKELQNINQEMFAQIRKIAAPPFDELREKMRKLQTTCSEKIMNVLTSEQKAKWKDLQGPRFNGEFSFGPTKAR